MSNIRGRRRLDGAVAVVPAGGRRIGAAVSQALPESGAHGVLAGRDKATINRHATGLPGPSTVPRADLGLAAEGQHRPLDLRKLNRDHHTTQR